MVSMPLFEGRSIDRLPGSMTVTFYVSSTEDCAVQRDPVAW